MRFPLSSFLFFSILSPFFHNPISAQCLEDQKYSLLTLFPSDHQLPWAPNTDCCSWEGITCDNATGILIGMDLTDRLISGPINSTALISISSLRTLNLSSNYFNNCSIPSGLDNLSNLTHLNLSYSGFTGAIPVEISRMKGLVSIDLSASFDMKGPSLHFPSPDFEYMIGNLTGLRELHLDYVYINAPVPELLAELANLSSLHLSYCFLHGQFPSKIFHMRNLKSLDVSYNLDLAGTLPEFPVNTSRLQTIILSRTGFYGYLPDSLLNLKFLTKLRLRNCGFRGVIPSSVAGMTQLVHLDLSLNSFDGEIHWLGKLAQLVYLAVDGNRFKGEIWWVGNLTQLVHLDLSWNKFSGKILSVLSATQLVYLDLSDNVFSGQIPSLAHLAQLVCLDLSGNNFHGRIPSLANPSQLSYLDLSKNNLSGQFPLLNFTSLAYFHVAYNNLSGIVPPSVFNIPTIQVIHLSHNQFDGQLDVFLNASAALCEIYLNNNKLRGQVPRSFFNLVHLSALVLHSNNFNDTVDLTMLQNLKNLSTLDLSGIRLSNNISDENSFSLPKLSNLVLRSCGLTRFPNFLAKLPVLFMLDLSSNKIDEEIPDWFWNIGDGSVGFFNLSHNMLTGLEQPHFHAGLSGPTVFDLHSNKISGQIPPSFCNKSNLALLDLSANNFIGTIPECLGQMASQLAVLNLAKNNLSGTMPDSFVDGCVLERIILNKNRLEGPLPRSLSNCTRLEVLDLGNNQIKDSFPFWLGHLPLRTLIL